MTLSYLYTHAIQVRCLNFEEDIISGPGNWHKDGIEYIMCDIRCIVAPLNLSMLMFAGKVAGDFLVKTHERK